MVVDKPTHSDVRRVTYFGGESPVADVALEGAFLGVGPDVDFQRRVAGKDFETNLAGRVAARSC